ncbi:hypothetical protein PVAND_006709 [Polypedilum vanderplanki]|uniref:Apterous n=1 Tax=Polypedilum vanderplanki TaxID=319348 RepID=A0A9J6C4G2_POLVA|nr:hypothetical protein PVAND_006709 [Polypedilum vanderplanki]
MGVCIEERRMHWQQSARYFGPNNVSPTTTNLSTVLNSPSSQCYIPVGSATADSILHRPSCLTCPTIAESNCGDEHSTISTTNLSTNFHSFHHTNMPPQQSHHLTTPAQLASNKTLMRNHHANMFDSCQNNFEHNQDDQQDGNSSGNFTNYFAECKKEAITPPNSIKNNNNNNNDYESSNQSPSRLQLKSEPIGNPSSPETEASAVATLGNTTDECAGCGRLIQDRFYLSAIDKKWHSGCLQCCVCENALDGQTSLYCREGNIYCKNDYFRIYGARRCSKCLASISSDELVMRARHLVYHIQCFSCAMCNQLLNKGDQFGIKSSAVFCRLHFDIDPSTSSPYSCSYTPSNLYCDSPPHVSSSPTTTLDDSYYSQHLGSSTSNANSITGLPQQPRQKGRPRKRKPKDIESLTANLDLNSDYLELGFGRGSMGSASSRTKRMRTSFKHHQLRTMKSYFAINHNPDAKDLKQLSQKTGLPKRVLQVWFQNARAKWRRMMMKQEGKAIDGEKGEGSIDLDTYNPHSPQYMNITSPTSIE